MLIVHSGLTAASLTFLFVLELTIGHEERLEHSYVSSLISLLISYCLIAIVFDLTKNE